MIKVVTKRRRRKGKLTCTYIIRFVLEMLHTSVAHEKNIPIEMNEAYAAHSPLSPSGQRTTGTPTEQLYEDV